MVLIWVLYGSFPKRGDPSIDPHLLHTLLWGPSKLHPPNFRNPQIIQPALSAFGSARLGGGVLACHCGGALIYPSYVGVTLGLYWGYIRVILGYIRRGIQPQGVQIPLKTPSTPPCTHASSRPPPHPPPPPPWWVA